MQYLNIYLGQGPQLNVQLTRMATEEIQDRQRMFELLDLLQVLISLSVYCSCDILKGTHHRTKQRQTLPSFVSTPYWVAREALSAPQSTKLFSYVKV